MSSSIKFNQNWRHEVMAGFQSDWIVVVVSSRPSWSAVFLFMTQVSLSPLKEPTNVINKSKQVFDHSFVGKMSHTVSCLPKLPDTLYPVSGDLLDPIWVMKEYRQWCTLAFRLSCDILLFHSRVRNNGVYVNLPPCPSITRSKVFQTCSAKSICNMWNSPHTARWRETVKSSIANVDIPAGWSSHTRVHVSFCVIVKCSLGG